MLQRTYLDLWRVDFMKKLIGFILVMVAFAVAGQMDYNDEQILQADYCDQVAQKVIPNYKNLNCEEQRK